MILLLACAEPGADSGSAVPEVGIDVLAGFTVGDEVILGIAPTAVRGDWADDDEPGAVLEVSLGENLARHVVLPGGSSAPAIVSLGAWDGGELGVATVEGDVAFDLYLREDPDAADVPVVCAPGWSDDVPLIVYEESGLWTWVFTDEDGGTGLIPTLLVALYGRPVDIEGLYDEGDGGGPEIQTTDHAWVPFDGPYEAAHPLLEVVTENGMLGPYDGAPWCFAPVPVAFTDAGGPRERVLDDNGWLLATSFAEDDREGWLAEDGGQDDRMIGAPDDYLYVDYEVDGDVKIAFEAEVDGAWSSSTNGLSTSDGLTDARLGGGVGRTAIELPPGATAADVTGVRVTSYEGAGTVVSARWFGLDADLVPVEVGAAAGVTFEGGGSGPL